MGRKDIPETEREKLKKKFRGMMRALYRQEGAMLDVEVLRESEVLDFIDAHAAVLDSTFDKVKMSDGMRLSLQKSDWIFSGMKTFHELHEAFPSLLDEHGERKPFERFYSDVRKVDETYNRNYLRAEYNFATASAEMAAKWEQYERDGDRYYLQYRTVGDSHVREEHAAINGTTLPVSHPFWDTHYPPNGWNCRCLVVQVRKSSHEQTSEEELSKRTKALAEQQAKSKGKSEMFRFNPGKQRKVFPDYNPYTIKQCNDCDLARGKASLTFLPNSENCAGCKLIHDCFEKKTIMGKLRTHYKNKLIELLNEKSVTKQFTEVRPESEQDGTPARHCKLKIVFDGNGISHMINDVLSANNRSAKNKEMPFMDFDDLLEIENILEKAHYHSSAKYKKTNIKGATDMHYFVAKLRGQEIWLNVARIAKLRTNGNSKGKVEVNHVLYAVNKKYK